MKPPCSHAIRAAILSTRRAIPEAAGSLDTNAAFQAALTRPIIKHRLRSATTAQETAMNYPTFRSVTRSVDARTYAPVLFFSGFVHGPSMLA
jgi:hypothetical protein